MPHSVSQVQEKAFRACKVDAPRRRDPALDLVGCRLASVYSPLLPVRRPLTAAP